MERDDVPVCDADDVSDSEKECEAEKLFVGDALLLFVDVVDKDTVTVSDTLCEDDCDSDEEILCDAVVDFDPVDVLVADAENDDDVDCEGDAVFVCDDDSEGEPEDVHEPVSE
jgi:hypothetical protein